MVPGMSWFSHLRLSALLLLPAALPFSAQAGKIDVHVNIPSATLKVLDDGREVATFPVRTGKRDTSTATGHGTITEKRERIVFRYLEGPRAGQIITRTHLDPTGETIDMPYDRLRALKLEFDGGIETIMHSTTEYWTIGFPVSHGCVGMNIDDMLKLYEMVGQPPAGINITYQTVELRDGLLLFHPDVYWEADRVAEILALGVPISDTASAQNRAAMIDRRLRARLDRALADLAAGRDARHFRKQMVVAVPVQEFQKPYRANARLIDFTLVEGDTFSSALHRGGIPGGLSFRIAAAAEGLNFQRMRPGDSILLQVEDGFITRLEYSGRQGESIHDLSRSGLQLPGS